MKEAERAGYAIITQPKFVLARHMKHDAGTGFLPLLGVIKEAPDNRPCVETLFAEPPFRFEDRQGSLGLLFDFLVSGWGDSHEECKHA